MALCVLLLAFGRTSSTPITPLKEFSSALPGGEGKILVFQYCVACHGPEAALSRLQAGEWMSNRWAEVIDEQDIAALADYLDENFGGAQESSNGGKDRLDTLLPPGDQKTVVVQKCTNCHDRQLTARRIESRAGFPPPVWENILTRMTDYGAPLTEQEKEQLNGYLASGLTPSEKKENSAKEFYSFLPVGPGRDLVAAHCLSCHGASELQKRLQQHSNETPAYWDVVVQRMKDKWDAPLEKEDMEAVIQYLNSHFSK